MESTKDSALPQPNSKTAKSYFANLATILSCAINIEAPSSDCQVYVPRPSSLNSFTDSTLELIFDSVKFDEDNLEGFDHRYGGKLVTFLSAEAASFFASQFPVDIVVGKKTHRFHFAPTIHSGVRVRVMGLPRPFSPEQLKLLGQSLALKRFLHTWFTTNSCAHAGETNRQRIVNLLCVPVFSPGG